MDKIPRKIDGTAQMIFGSLLFALLGAFIVGIYAEGKLETVWDKLIFWGSLSGGIINALEVTIWMLDRM